MEDAPPPPALEATPTPEPDAGLAGAALVAGEGEADPLPTPAAGGDAAGAGDPALGAATDGACGTALPTDDEPEVVGAATAPATEVPGVEACGAGAGEAFNAVMFAASGDSGAEPRLIWVDSAPPEYPRFTTGAGTGLP